MKLKKEKNLLDPIVIDQILFKILGNISNKLKQLLPISNFYYIILIIKLLYISATLGERMNSEHFNSVKMLSSGNRQFTFSTQKVHTK